MKIAVAHLVLITVGIMTLAGCSSSPEANAKASSALLAQVYLRQQQVAAPTAARLEEMRAMGMQTENIPTQRVFIYLSQPLTPARLAELQSLGVTAYPESWIPPVGNNPTGFVLADMPVGSLDSLAAKDYVIRLDTAERQLQPQIRPGG
jgi:hypothetical protein